MIRTLVGLVAALALGASLAVMAPLSVANAHEERESTFPDGSASVPKFRGLGHQRNRVVCRPDSGKRIAAMPAGALKTRNKALLRQCDFGSIQTAINSIERRNTSIYVLPGVYHETKWANRERSEECSNLESEASSSYIGSIADPLGEEEESDPIALSYGDQRRCPNNLNLVSIFGDSTPDNDSISCDSKFCGTQIAGTGRRMGDVLLDNRFSRLNAIRVERMSGFYLRNMTVQQSEFNAVYVMESDGFVLDRLRTRANDEYGILAFASDHGVIKNSDAYYNGDSGIYPGSASDVNGENDSFTPTRYSIVIKNNRSHNNTLGYSGTAGNSVWAYNNRFYNNATGVATDSLFPGHPGLPQDHARWSDNKIYSNNVNYYTKYVDQGACEGPIKDRGYMQGVVCPVVPVPVGTGVLIAGGNFNSTDGNRIWDNWRYGTMQFMVPAALRDDYDPTKQQDTSHFNRTRNNVFGITPGGKKLHNGMDHWWDDQGEGNCWQNNRSSRGEPTDNFLVGPTDCASGGTPGGPPNAVKDAGFLTCSQYDRNDEFWRDPPNCNWFVTPPKPTNSSGDPFPLPVSGLATSSGSGTPASQTGDPLILTSGLGLGGAAALLVARRRRRRA